MKQVISSRFTFIYKLVLPILLVVYGGFGIIILLIKRQSQDFLSLLTIFILMIIGGVVLYQTKKKLKKVWVENNALYISDYINAISLPFSEIASVQETWPGIWGGSRFPTRQITIHLKAESKFGREIVMGTRLELIKRPEGIDLLNQLIAGTKI